MLTGYWSIDAFILANVILWVVVALIYAYYQFIGGGLLHDQSKDDEQRSEL